MSADLVHLIRHGEVANPHQVVYADLPGYGLSPLGRVQAEAAGQRLANAPVQRVLSSPLLRAAETAELIAARHGLTVEREDRLTEWAVAMRWAGVRWHDLDAVFPGELDAYLKQPHDLPFAGETLRACGERVAIVVRDVAAAMDGGELVVVSHQDPIHAGHLALVGDEPADYHAGKPAHAGVVTLLPQESTWTQLRYWEPDQGAEFPPLE